MNAVDSTKKQQLCRMQRRKMHYGVGFWKRALYRLASTMESRLRHLFLVILETTTILLIYVIIDVTLNLAFGIDVSLSYRDLLTFFLYFFLFQTMVLLVTRLTPGYVDFLMAESTSYSPKLRLRGKIPRLLLSKP